MTATKKSFATLALAAAVIVALLVFQDRLEHLLGNTTMVILAMAVLAAICWKGSLMVEQALREE